MTLNMGLICFSWLHWGLYIFSDWEMPWTEEPGGLQSMGSQKETWVPSLGREDPLEEEMAGHSSTLAWKIPWTEEPGGLQSMGVTRGGPSLTEWYADQA